MAKTGILSKAEVYTVEHTAVDMLNANWDMDIIVQHIANTYNLTQAKVKETIEAHKKREPHLYDIDTSPAGSIMAKDKQNGVTMMTREAAQIGDDNSQQSNGRMTPETRPERVASTKR